jgi:hypothetical protein
LVNSRLGLFSAAPSRSRPLGTLTLPGRPFSRSYGASLPSSLTRGLPSTLVCSTCRPVSVCGTDTASLARGFSRQQGSIHLAWLPTPDHHASGLTVQGICLPDHPTRLDEGCPSLNLPPCVTPSLFTPCSGTGMLTGCPSPTALALGLGPTHPQLINIAAEPFDIRWGGFSPPSRYSYRHSHSSPLQHAFQHTFSADDDAPLPSPHVANHVRESAASVVDLSPVHCRRPGTLDQ